MKKRHLAEINLIIISVLFLLLATSCKKDDDETTVTDIDGNIYNIVAIGSQKWMKENLKTTKFNDGSTIPLEEDGPGWINLRTPGMCWYNNNTSNKTLYGGMYNWYAVNTNKLCPTGWHVPSDNEWKQMEKYLGMTQAEADDIEFRGTDEGGKLKETGTTHWTAPNTGATNESGFTALPGGYRSMVGGNYVYAGTDSYWWTSSGKSDIEAWERGLNNNVSTIDRIGSPKYDGFYVRCIKD